MQGYLVLYWVALLMADFSLAKKAYNYTLAGGVRTMEGRTYCSGNPVVSRHGFEKSVRREPLYPRLRNIQLA